MWATTAAAALLASLAVVSAYTVDVVVPAEPELGSRVVLQCNYKLESGEHIQQMTWTKGSQVFMTYRQQPNDEYSFTPISDIDIDLDNSTPGRIILKDVQDSASGIYGVRMSIASDRDGSVSVNTFSHDQDMLVGGEAVGTLGNRFGGGSGARPSGGSTITSSSSSSSSSSSGSVGVGVSGSVGGGAGTLGNRFGGNRPVAAVRPPQAAAAPAAPRPPLGAGAVQNSAANGLASAQATLQNAVKELQNALNSAIGQGR